MNYSKLFRTLSLGVVLMGSTWNANAAAADTTYTIGTIDGKARYDTLTIGDVGDFSTYANPISPVNTLYIDLVETQASTALAANDAATGTADMASIVREIWIRGNAANFNTLLPEGTANPEYALPAPSKNCTIHFALSASPAATPRWFHNASPLYAANRPTWKIIIEPGSADPMLDAGLLANVREIILGNSITAPGALTSMAKFSRHPRTSTIPSFTTGGNTEFGAFSGLALSGAGGHIYTFNENADIEDIVSQSTGTVTIAAGKTLKIKGAGAATAAQTTFLPGSGNLTLGAGASYSVANK